MPAKRIYLNQREKVIGGVCAGIADYFDIDVAWVRLAFVLSIFIHGFGVIAYIVAWIVFPKDPRSAAEVEQMHARAEAQTAGAERARRRRTAFSHGSRNAVGIILVLLGLLFFMDQNFYWFRFDAFWPLILIALGLYMLVRAAQPSEDESPSLAGNNGATVAAPPTSGSDRATPKQDEGNSHA